MFDRLLLYVAIHDMVTELVGEMLRTIELGTYINYICSTNEFYSVNIVMIQKDELQLA